MGIEGLYLPIKIDLFVGILIPIFVGAIIAISSQWIEQKIKREKAVPLILVLIALFVIIYISYCNLPGYYLFQNAYKQYLNYGCDVSADGFRQAVQSNPRILSAREWYVECQIELGAAKDIPPIMEPLKEILIDNADYWQEMTKTYWYIGDYEKMISSMKKMVVLDPARILFLLDIASYLINHNDIPTSVLVLDVGQKNLLSSSGLINYAEDQNPVTNLELIKSMAETYYSIRQYDSVIKLVEKYMTISPNEGAEWITGLGEILHRESDYINAERFFRVVRVYDLQYSPAIFWLAWALHEQGKYQDALDHFNLCIAQDTDQYRISRCYAGKGFTYNEMGDFGKAKEFLKTSLILNADQEDVATTLSSIP